MPEEEDIPEECEGLKGKKLKACIRIVDGDGVATGEHVDVVWELVLENQRLLKATLFSLGHTDKYVEDVMERDVTSHVVE